MPRETGRHAAVLKKLQGVIKHTDPDVAAGRKLTIRRWLKTYVEHVKYFKDIRLQFLYNVFQDENCWLKLSDDKPGTRLNNTALGQRLTEEERDEISNPLRRYEIACSYCVVDKILPLFQKRFESYKNSFPSNAVDGNGRRVTDQYIRSSLLDSMKRKGDEFNFWINRESGELKQPSNAAEGFDSAVKFKWSEGVEYFYNQLEEKDKEKKLTEAIIALSRAQSIKKEAHILDFCVNNIAEKDTLLQKLLQKDKVVYFLLTELIESCFFDTVNDLVKCWCYEGVSARGDHSDKIFSQRDYEIFLSSLSHVMLKNPESSTQARSVIMKIWRCDSLDEYRKAAVNTSNYTVHVSGMLAGLIVNWKRGDVCKSDGKKEILDIMSFAKNCFPEKFELFKEVMIENLRLCGREGMMKGVDYGELAEKLFSELERTTLPPGGDGSRYNLRSRSKAHAVGGVASSNSKKTSLPLDGSGERPQSMLGVPGVIGFSDRSK